jgi:hypothetical protein
MAESDLVTPPTLRVAVAKPKFGIYYVLLIIALCAMLVACGVLYKFVRDFGGFGTVKGKISAAERPAIYFCHRAHRVEVVQLVSVNSVSFVAKT